MTSLAGRTALVTGGSRGIGRAIAAAFAAAGADVVISSRREHNLVEAVDAIGSDRVSWVAANAGDEEQAAACVDEVLRRHGRLDILVNNAGTNVQQKVLDVTEEAWGQVMDTNLRGPFFLAQAVGRHMVAQGSGRIVNMASTFAALGYPGRSVYAASKGALVQLTRVMALEWASKGVTVNAVGPTAIRSKMNEDVLADADYAGEVLRRIPTGRFAQPDDVCGAVAFLVSPAAAMVNGHLLLVDGGWSAI